LLLRRVVVKPLADDFGVDLALLVLRNPSALADAESTKKRAQPAGHVQGRYTDWG
jgi:hypothetical protein